MLFVVIVNGKKKPKLFRSLCYVVRFFGVVTTTMVARIENAAAMHNVKILLLHADNPETFYYYYYSPVTTEEKQRALQKRAPQRQKKIY